MQFLGHELLQAVEDSRLFENGAKLVLLGNVY
jgi:hypothetical protein